MTPTGFRCTFNGRIDDFVAVFARRQKLERILRRLCDPDELSRRLLRFFNVTPMGASHQAGWTALFARLFEELHNH